MLTIAEAAALRAREVRAPADRPTKRRCAEDPASRAFVRASITGLQVRASTEEGGPLEFEGYASVTERAYQMYDFFGPYNEIVSAGAFDATLAMDGLDVPLVLAHDSLRRIARTTNGTLSLAADDTGLLARATLDPTDPDVAYITPKLLSGLVDEMSFMFRIDSGQWSPDYDEFRINAVDIHRGDVAIVGYGANPFTAGAALRAEAAPAPKTRQVVTDDDVAIRVY